MKIAGVTIPTMAWDWLAFQWKHDIPFEVEYFAMGFCLLGTYGSLQEDQNLWGSRSSPAIEWKVERGSEDSFQLMYPMLIGANFILGRSDENPTARLGKLCKLGDVVDERFVAMTGFEHPMTFQSTLFDSGYVLMLDGFCEMCFLNLPLLTRLFHVDQPDQYCSPVTMIGTYQCVGCQLPQPLCNCMFKLIMAKNFSEQSLWRNAQHKKVGKGNDQTLVHDRATWFSYSSFFSQHNGISSFLSIKINLGSPGMGTLDVNMCADYKTFQKGARFDAKLVDHIQRILGRSLYCMSDHSVKKLTIPRTDGKRNTAEMRRHESSSSNADAHVKKRTSLSLRNYICMFCSKDFYMKHHLQVHMSSVHGNRRDFVCEQCTFAFSTDTKRRRHIRSVHEKERPYTCTHCAMSFSQLSNLKRHQIKKHDAFTKAGQKDVTAEM